MKKQRKTRGRGWHGDSKRHSLARFGVKTAIKRPAEAFSTRDYTSTAPLRKESGTTIGYFPGMTERMKRLRTIQKSLGEDDRRKRVEVVNRYRDYVSDPRLNLPQYAATGNNIKFMLGEITKDMATDNFFVGRSYNAPFGAIYAIYRERHGYDVDIDELADIFNTSPKSIRRQIPNVMKYYDPPFMGDPLGVAYNRFIFNRRVQMSESGKRRSFEIFRKVRHDPKITGIHPDAVAAGIVSISEKRGRQADRKLSKISGVSPTSIVNARKKINEVLSEMEE
jgi:transcription initiation factor TFIIIB Brf1 subunit/transcription initiation factor TFIIB